MVKTMKMLSSFTQINVIEELAFLGIDCKFKSLSTKWKIKKITFKNLQSMFKNANSTIT